MPKADRQATEAAGFTDPKSHVLKDGRWVLYREDWKAQIRALNYRSGGRCENIKETGLGQIRCWAQAVHPHHRKLRSIARDDRLSNLLAVCFPCHLALDAQQRKEKRERRNR